MCVWEREQILGVFGSGDVFLSIFFNKYIIKIIYFYIFLKFIFDISILNFLKIYIKKILNKKTK